METLEAPLQIICDSAQELYCEVLRAISNGEETSSVKENRSIGSGWGTRDRPTKELRYVTLILENPRNRFINSPMCPIEQMVARTVLATLSDTSDVATLAFYDRRAVEFSDDGKTLPTNYGYRIRHLNQTNQIRQVIRQFQKDPNTRRALIHIHAVDDYEKRYAPCIDSLHFLIRNGALECQSLWRSENALTLLPVNLFEFTMLHELIASALDIPIGRYVQTVTSLHYYLDDQVKLEKVLETVMWNKKPDEMQAMPIGSLEEAAALVEFEKEYRQNPQNPNALNRLESLSEYWQHLGKVIAYVIAKNSQNFAFAEFLLSDSPWKDLIIQANRRAS